MTADKKTSKQTTSQRPAEQKGVATDIVLPLATGGLTGAVAGAANAIVANAINKPKKDK